MTLTQRRAWKRNIRDYGCARLDGVAEEEWLKARPGRRNTAEDGHEHCLRFHRCWHKMICQKSPRWPEEKESCWKERGWMGSTASYKHPHGPRSTHEPLKYNNPKKMLNPS